MEKKYKITWESAYIRIDLFDHCTLDEIIATVEEVVNANGFDAKTPTIYDLTKADISSFDAEKVVELSQKVANILEKIGEVRSALVSAKEINISLMRFFQAVYEGKQIEIEVFPTFDEALSWVNR